MSRNTRTIALLGEEKFNKLKNSKVLVLGLGGVGGYVLESLVRAGVGTIGLCDFDLVDESNINRQILATVDTVGMRKVDVAEKRALSINPDVVLRKYPIKVSDPKELDLDYWDFIADAIDDTPAKLRLMELCKDKMISSMGTGNKMNSFGYKITNVEKTEGDPLARAIRKKLREKNIKGVTVLYSSESPVVEPEKAFDEDGNRVIPTISYMPAIAGLEIGSYIINKLLEK